MNHRLITVPFMLALIGLLSLSSALAASTGQTGEIGPAVTVQDTPVTLTGAVASFYLRDPKLFWHVRPPACPPTASADAPQAATYETIQRVPARGGPSRYLYFQAQACGSSQIQSNLVADDNYVYWTGPNGLMRLSTEANPGDAPELVNGLLAGRAELAVDDTHLFVLSFDSNNYGTLYRVIKSSGTRVFMTGPGTNASNLQTSYSFSGGQQRYFVYWIQGGDLRRFNVDTLANTLLAIGVTGYYAEGGRTICSGNVCFSADTVFIGQNNQVVTFSNLTGITSAPVYCSNNPCSNDASRRIISLTADGDNLFFFEERQTGCAPLCSYTDFLLRTPRGGGTVDTVYFYTGVGAGRLTTDGTMLYWQDSAVRRLPNNAAALPSINLLAAGLWVTQGVQDDVNSVPFIQNRRTFVRFFVQTPLPGDRPVLALLHGSWNGGSGGPLLPINPAGTEIRIKVFRDHDNINDSFLFELPWEWTTKSNLMLTATVNPYQFPLEPNYGDNTSTAGPFNFIPSPALKVTLAGLGYRINNQTYYPKYEDVLGAASLVRRLFPLANSAGQAGFIWNYWQLLDEGLASRVNMTNSECNDYLTVENGKMVDRRNLCSTRYANHLLAYLRSAWKYSDKLFVYGMISNAGPGAGVRGQAGGNRVSSGAAQNASTAAHEIAHTLERDHPFKGSSLDTKVCGNTPQDGGMDNNYPYTNGLIGVSSLEGFDGGDGLLKIPFSIKPSDKWYDFISYCSPQWVSDYTYKGMYTYMLANPPQALALAESPQVAGDWLYVAGNLRPDGSGASISFVRGMSNPASVPPLAPGDYALRLFDAGGNQLANHPFTPAMAQNGAGYLNIDQAVPFVAGTRQVRVVRLSNSQTLASWSLSANPPTVGNVTLPGAPNPVTGTITVNWVASDPDGDPLTFDLLYQRTGETDFRPVRLGVSGTSAQIETSAFSGGGGLLRVVVSDGALTAQADSAPFAVAGKRPTVHIANPSSGLRLRYGQLVNFSGEAFDVQDGWLSGAALVWRDQKGNTLGTGPMLSAADLLVGTNTITLTATNTLGLSASASVIVIVDDDLRLPGPYLSIGPDQVSWHLAPGTTAPQSADVSVSNAGSGNLNWTASSDQPWLTLSAASGITPITLTVTANPAPLSAGSVYTATVTIIGDPGGGQPVQTVRLPVRVALGNVVDTANVAPARQVFLPLIRR